MKWRYSLSALSLIGTCGAIILFAGIPGQPADNAGVICAAIHPCTKTGSVFAPYDQGACAEKYAIECALKYQDDREMSVRLNQCLTDNHKLAQKAKRLKKSICKYP